MRFLYIIGISVASVIFALALFFVIDTQHDRTHVPHGITVAGVIPVGGMTYEEAADHIETILRRSHVGTRLIISDQEIAWEKSLSLAEMQPTIVREELMQRLHIVEDQDTFLNTLHTWIRMRFGYQYDIAPTIHWLQNPKDLFASYIAEVNKKTKDLPLISTPESLTNALEKSLWVSNPATLVIATDRGLKTDVSFSIPQTVYITSDDDEHAYTSVLTHDQLYGLLLPGETGGEWFVNMQLLRKVLPPLQVADAWFDTSNPEKVLVIPSRVGIALDYVTMSNHIVKELTQGGTSIAATYTNLVQPTFTTEMAEAMGITHMVSSFTTYHPAGATRVENIHLIADMVNNALVPPGEQFNLNAYVGKRTAAKGFKKAGMIFNGELVDDFGGGVSQFATTLYNAVFWGGFKDIKHKAHSWYFSRYPEGIEATVSWPDVDLVFENDYASTLLIKTAYTKDSITVMFYGNNDGRIVGGEQRSGKTTMNIIQPGGELARSVKGGASSRSNFKEPGVKFMLDTSKEVFSSPREHGTGQKGWTVTAWRTITKPTKLEDGTLSITEEKSSWPVVYLPEPYVVYVHSCVIPGEAPDTLTQLKNCAPPTVKK